MNNSLQLKLFNKSKSGKKEPKYIPAAIIPSVAFVANPTLPTSRLNIDENSIKLLSSTVNSSLVGLSAEYKDHRMDDSIDCGTDDNYNQHLRSNDFDIPEPLEVQRPNRQKRTKKKQEKTESNNDSKRHIDIASGLYEDLAAPGRTRPIKKSDNIVVQNVYEAPDAGSAYSLDHYSSDRSSKNVHFNSGNMELDHLEMSTDQVDGLYNIDGNLSKNSGMISEQRLKSLGFDINTNKSVGEDSDMDYAYKSVNYSQSAENMLTVPPRTEEILLTAPSQFKDNDYSKESSPPDAVNSHSSRNAKRMVPRHEGDDRDTRLLKDEIRLLKDQIYRLNAELSQLLPAQEPGRSIGKSVFPGKGPAPSWIMNTKYLTPLFAVYDRRFLTQNAYIKKMQGEIVKFEKEVHQVMVENERLHTKLQENQKGGTINNNDLRIIMEQTKLVIQENQLLLEQLDLEQQRTKELDKKYITDVAQLKTSLTSVTSERDESHQEISRLVGRISEINSSTKTDGLNQNQIDDLLKDKRSLEIELEKGRDNERRMEKKVEKYKTMVKTEKEFRQYLSDVIDKSNEIANERDKLMEEMALYDSEIRRMTTKLINEIRYNLDLGVDASPADLSLRKTDDITLQHIHSLEAWMTMLIQNVDDLNLRCRRQEKDVHYYQNLLREKDKSMQECENENEALESKLDSLWRNAIKDS